MIDRYSTYEMKEIWSEKNKYNLWQKIWVDVSVYFLNKNGSEHVEVMQSITDEDVNEVLKIEKECKHDVIAFLTFLENKYGETAKYFHFGMTSSDVVDTTFAIRINQSSLVLRTRLDFLSSLLRNLAVKHKYDIMLGRTHGMPADVTTLGLLFLLWYQDIEISKHEMLHSVYGINGKLSGSVGNYLTIDRQIEEEVCKKNSIPCSVVENQVVQRDKHARFFHSLACLCSIIEKITISIRNLHRYEIGEVKEGFSKGQCGSSAMPHKKNPIGCENLSGIARVMRSYSSVALENIPLWNERDISHSSAERIIGPSACNLADYSVNKLHSILTNLVVDKHAIRKNIDSDNELIHSQRVLLDLIESGMKRSEAYKIVQEASFECQNTGKKLSQELRDRSVKIDYDKVFNVEDTLRSSVDNMFRRVLE